MDIFANLHDYDIALQGLQYISQLSLRHLLLHYIVEKRNLLVIQNNDNDRKKFSKLFKYLQSSDMKKLKEKLDKEINYRFVPRIYTNLEKIHVKDEVEFESFDIPAIEKILQYFPDVFPFIHLNKKVRCKAGKSNHLGKCCKDCDKKHDCGTCGKEKCINGCCLNPYFSCDHPCDKCSNLRSECKENSMVCCTTCGFCYFCSSSECVNRKIRKAIQVIIKLRHLHSHTTPDQPWQQLADGNFDSEDFRSVQSWDQLCLCVQPHFRFILKFLKNETLIPEEDYDDYKYYIKKLPRFQKQHINLNFLDRIIQMYREENIINIASLPPTSERKQFTLKIEMKVKGTISSRMHGLSGELSETICKGIKEVIIRNSSPPMHEDHQGNSSNHHHELQSEVIVNPEFCNIDNRLLKRSKVFVTAKVKPTTVEKEKELLNYYEKKFAAESITFCETIKQRCKENLRSKNIRGDASLTGFSLGCIQLEFVIAKSKDEFWNREEIKVVLPEIKETLIDMIGNVEVGVAFKNDSPTTIHYGAENNEIFYQDLHSKLSDRVENGGSFQDELPTQPTVTHSGDVAIEDSLPDEFQTQPSAAHSGDVAIEASLSDEFQTQPTAGYSGDVIIEASLPDEFQTQPSAAHSGDVAIEASLPDEFQTQLTTTDSGDVAIQDSLSDEFQTATRTDSDISLQRLNSATPMMMQTVNVSFSFRISFGTVGKFDALDTYQLSMKARQLAYNKITEQAKQQRYCTFLGYGGVGKSFLLNQLLHDSNISEFRSDENIVYSLTSEIRQEEFADVVYTDTPGYSDEYKSNAMQKAIKYMIGQGGHHQIIFVMTLESGRVRRNDILMVKEILKVSNDITKYGIIINKLSPKVYRILSDNQHYRSQLLQLFPTSEDNRIASLLLVPDNTPDGTSTTTKTHISDELTKFTNSLSFVDVNPVDAKTMKRNVIQVCNRMDNLEEEIRKVTSDIKQMKVALQLNREKLRLQTKRVEDEASKTRQLTGDSETESEVYTETDSSVGTHGNVTEPDVYAGTDSLTSTGNDTETTKKIRYRKKKHKRQKRSKKVLVKTH